MATAKKPKYPLTEPAPGQRLTPGQAAARRGSVARRPWHPTDLELGLEDVVGTAGDLVEDLAQLSHLAKRLPAVKTAPGRGHRGVDGHLAERPRRDRCL